MIMLLLKWLLKPSDKVSFTISIAVELMLVDPLIALIIYSWIQRAFGI